MADKGEHEKLSQASAAIRRGDLRQARTLIQAVLHDNPRSVAAWGWACQAAETDGERIACLRHILDIEPQHAAARRYLAQLLAAEQPSAAHPAAQSTVSEPKDASGPPTPRPRTASLPLTLLTWVLQIPAPYLIGGLLAVAFFVAFLYYSVNSDFFGLAVPDWDRLAISSSYEEITSTASDGRRWKVMYERTTDSRFAGLVRHASPIRFAQAPFLTHDILVTSGDYANADLVKTSVIDHHFFWSSATSAQPQGTINLLHTVVLSEDIYHKLLRVRRQDQVIITGREIGQIDMYDQNGVYQGWWRDTGCNTLLVKSVEIALQ